MSEIMSAPTTNLQLSAAERQLFLALDAAISRAKAAVCDGKNALEEAERQADLAEAQFNGALQVTAMNHGVPVGVPVRISKDATTLEV